MSRVSGGTHRPLNSSFLRLPYRSLNINHKKELLRGLWVVLGFSGWPLVESGSAWGLRFKAEALGLDPVCSFNLEVCIPSI